jgi:hypothetical protein
MNQEYTLNPAALYLDNHSYRAVQAARRWDKAVASGDRPWIITCCDARVILPESRVIPSIAAGQDHERYVNLMNQTPGLVLTHFDGSTLRDNGLPSGCGGQDARRSMSSSDECNGALESFIAGVAHYDPIINAVQTAQELKTSVSTPIVAAAQDHLTGETFPLAVFAHDTQVIHPHISPDYLPRVVGKALLELDERVKTVIQYLGQYEEAPTLEQYQKVQNPHTIRLTSSPRPASVLYPNVFTDLPNQVFTVHAPYPPEDTALSLETINAMVAQAQYPITHALEHWEDPAKSFSRLRNMIIELRNAQDIQNLYDALYDDQVVGGWMQRPGIVVCGIVKNKGSIRVADRLYEI